MTFTRILLCALAFPLMALAQWPQAVKTVGNVTTNDEVVFADNSGRLIRAKPGLRDYLNNPTNSGETGFVLIFGGDGKPIWAPIQSASLISGDYTNRTVLVDAMTGQIITPENFIPANHIATVESVESNRVSAMAYAANLVSNSTYSVTPIMVITTNAFPDSDTNVLIVSGAGVQAMNGTYIWSDFAGCHIMGDAFPIAPRMYDSMTGWYMGDNDINYYQSNTGSHDPRDTWRIADNGSSEWEPVPEVIYGTLTTYTTNYAIQVIGGGSGGSSGGGIGTFTNVQINGVNNTNFLNIANGSNTTWTLSNGVWRLNVPLVIGPQGIQGPAGTTNYVVTVNVTTNLNIMTMTITNITVGGSGVGSFTNVQINGVVHSNGVAFADSESVSWTLGTDGVWRANSWSSNGLDWVVGGEHIGSVSNNGITLYKGTLQLYEEDLDCNVRLYDGSRLVPSLTFNGHANDWGLYGRGYNGNTIAGWSVAGTEIGLLHGTGITLMSTNFAFSGTHIGDLAGCWGYPEPIFNSWKTNMSFSTLVLSNLTVTPGSFQIKDTYNTDRAMLDTTGFTYKDAGGITRATIGSEIQIKQGNGLTVTKLNTSGFSTIDAVSQMPLVTIGVGAWDLYSVMSSNGKTNILFNSFSGLRLWDPFQYVLRSTLSYTGIELLDITGLVKFKTDTVSGMTTIANASITNSGNLAFYGPNGTNLCTITGTNGAIKIRGVDSDTRYPLAPTAMTAFVATNIIGTVTQRLWYTAQGVVTNHIP